MKLVTGLILMLGVVSSQPSENLPARTFSNAANVFSVNLLKVILPQHGGNVIMSPMSVSTLLAMLAQGARDNSKYELEKVLQLSQREALIGYGSLSKTVKGRRTNSSSVLEVGNRIFLKRQYNLEPEFRKYLLEGFDSDIEAVDFVQPAIATRQINGWVARATRNRIQNILGPDSLSANTQLVLANAIFFKGLWKNPFSLSQTNKQTFSPYSGYDITVPFMYQHGNFRAGEDTNLGAMWVELPFDGDEISMVLVLPTQRHGLDAVVKQMTSVHVTNMMNTRTTKSVELSLPRFRLDTQIPLVPALQQLGLKDIFNMNSNLAGISGNNDRLQVSDILQKAEIQIDEKGGSAAAATLGIVNTLSLANYNDDVTFLADHPFLALIVYKANLVPLFIARVTDPSRS